MVSDLEKSKAFYRKIFDWRFDDETYPGYTLIQTGGEPGGGMMTRPPGSPMASLNTYFEVAAVDETLRAVVEAGGSVIVPKTEIPGIGWFGMFLDVDRIPIAILEPLPGSRPT
jgi:predicted enzyme related to lactoylglutathione lyase